MKNENLIKIITIVTLCVMLIFMFFISHIKYQKNEIDSLEDSISSYKTDIQSYKNKLVKCKQEEAKKLRQEIKNLINNLQPKLDPTVTKTIINSVCKYSNEYNLPPKLIIAIMYRESTFNPLSVSSANCVGLMQINPKAHQDKIEELELSYPQLFFIDNNIRLGCMIFREYYDRFDQDIYTTLKRYVGGQHNSYAKDILAIFTESFIKD